VLGADGAGGDVGPARACAAVQRVHRVSSGPGPDALPGARQIQLQAPLARWCVADHEVASDWYSKSVRFLIGTGRPCPSRRAQQEQIIIVTDYSKNVLADGESVWSASGSGEVE
jgi:hypothetical protein